MKTLNDDRVRSFEDRLRGWSRRPPALSAAAARTRVVARLPRTSPAVPWLRLAAAAAVLFVLVVAAWLGAPRPAGEAGSHAGAVAQVAVGPDVVVWALDARTTVYFVLGPGGQERGGA